MGVKYKIDLTLVNDRAIYDIERIYYEVKGHGGGKNAGIDQKLSIAVLYVWRDLCQYHFTPKGKELTLSEFYNVRKKTGEEFIHIHRLNYMTYRLLMEFCDWLDDRKMLTFNVKGYWKKIERTFNEYQNKHKTMIDKSAWMTIQDHVRLASDEVMPFIPSVESAIRDYLIQHRKDMLAEGQKDDITILTRIQTCLLFCAATRNTYQNFFRNVIDGYGVDLSRDFCFAELSSIIRNFVSMSEQMGVRFCKDKDGDYVLKGVTIDRSIRVESAWNAIVSVVTNEDIMDDTALRAINMNPETKADYEKIIAKIEERDVKSALVGLSDKFKVSCL